jgi:transposase
MNLTPLPEEVWARTPPEAQAYIRALEARVVALETALQQLEDTVRQLEATVQHVQEQLAQNSRTSSRPPSSDPPRARGQRPRREPSGRRPGGQPGHEGHNRALVPLEEVDAVIPVKPERCSHCQHLLGGEDPQPQRHQVTEIPPVRPVVTEY